MKIRNGFISNSSSSSFIIGVKNGETKITIPIEVDLKKYGKVIKTKEELAEYFVDRYGEALLLDEKHVLELYTKSLETIKSGKMIIVGDFSSDGDPLESFLCEAGFPETLGNVTVIQNASGY